MSEADLFNNTDQIIRTNITAHLFKMAVEKHPEMGEDMMAYLKILHENFLEAHKTLHPGNNEF